jgi:hypothetical protein
MDMSGQIHYFNKDFVKKSLQYLIKLILRDCS